MRFFLQQIAQKEKGRLIGKMKTIFVGISPRNTLRGEILIFFIISYKKIVHLKLNTNFAR